MPDTQVPGSSQHLLQLSLRAAGGPAWSSLRSLHLTGTAHAGGLSGPFEQWIDLLTGRFATRLSLGPATMAVGHDGRQAWQRSANGEVVVQDSEAGWDPLESTCRHASLSIL